MTKRIFSSFLSLMFFLLLIIPRPSSALVDYSEADAPMMTPPKPAPRPSFARKRPATQSKAKLPLAQAGQSAPSGWINFAANYETLNYQQETGESKVNFINIATKLNTPYNLYLDLDYWMASSSDEELTTTSSQQAGNPRAVIGFNWLNFGKAAEQTTVDLFVGASVKTTNSDFGSSRTDQIFGVETTKAFYSFILGLGYELRLTGTPGNLNESDIGNIQRMTAVLGWNLSSDIKMLLEANYVTIGSSDDSGRASLSEKVSFGMITPSLYLGITPFVDLELGARFRTKRAPQSDEFVNAKVWQYKGSYGNSIFAGLNVSM
jgi:hypothetical protein